MVDFKDVPDDLLREAAEATDIAILGRVCPACVDKARSAIDCDPYHMSHFDARWFSHLRGYLLGRMTKKDNT